MALNFRRCVKDKFKHHKICLNKDFNHIKIQDTKRFEKEKMFQEKTIQTLVQKQKQQIVIPLDDIQAVSCEHNQHDNASYINLLFHPNRQHMILRSITVPLGKCTKSLKKLHLMDKIVSKEELNMTFLTSAKKYSKDIL